MKITEVVSEALDRLSSWPGYRVLSEMMEEFPNMQIYLAGGVIRDLFLERFDQPKDFDIFLGGESIERALAMIKLHGSVVKGPFGSPRWYPVDDPARYCDVIPVSRFYNGLWPCEDILDVLNQFDFTGNAVAIDVRNGTFYNPQNGPRDMRRCVMRMVRFDYPDEPIAPGSLLNRPVVLWFRILHYAAKLDLEIEQVTMRWLIRNRSSQLHFKTFAATFFSPHTSYLDPLSGVSDE